MSNASAAHGFGTNAVHAGRPDDASSTPIYMTATTAGQYTRGDNPTITAMEASIAALEGGGRAIATACGSSAVAQALLPLLKTGDRVVSHRCVYDWTEHFIYQDLAAFGIESLRLDLRDLDALRAAVEQETRIVYLEPVANPSLDVIDVKAVTEIAHDAGALVVADNTFLTPYLFRPLEAGVDVVVHSATKYFSGHGDTLAGVIIADDEDLAEKIYLGRTTYGGIISPFNAFLVLRGISTLHVRMDRHCANARQVAEFLRGHPEVVEVRYPGLPGDPGHRLAAAQMPAFGGMLGFQIDGGDERVDAFAAALKVCKPWVSLGDVKTLVYVRRRQDQRGIPEGYARLSVGLEDVDDIIADLDQALTR